MLIYGSLPSDATRDLFGDKTRGKILAASLNCFNEDGFDRVTTAQLAETADVLAGTLWYHFKAKNDLVLAHLEVFEARLDTHLSGEIAGSPDAIVADFLDTFGILWEFRYLLRDPLSALDADGSIRLRLRDTYQLIEQRTESRIRQAVTLGFMDIEDADTPSLALSCIVIGRYWFDYARIRFDGDPDGSDLRLQCMQQVLSVIWPYFTDKARDLIASSKVDEALTKTR
ncbi:MAG: TetR/AcrR family transcriptional regulator [Pseudomonadota bacterium]